jgi:hypothetical protein
MSGFKVRIINMELLWIPYYYFLRILKNMKFVFKKIEKLIDIYIMYFFYSERKQHRYIKYMKKKWGKIK